MKSTQRLPVLPVAVRLLTFQSSAKELLSVDYSHLLFGLLCTWIVGMGRSWDDPHANVAQYWGVGSVVYVFALSLLLWASIAPLAPIKISYFQVLTFVCLVSPPALLYAIPVEKFASAATSRTLNALLLCVVASWRVALLNFYLRRAVSLLWGQRLVAISLPLSLILTPITLLNAMNSVASAMGGLREGQTVTEPATVILNIVGTIAIFSVLPLLIAHHYMAQRRRAEPRTGTSEP